jgi:hypothetical protein
MSDDRDDYPIVRPRWMDIGERAVEILTIAAVGIVASALAGAWIALCIKAFLIGWQLFW